MSDEVTANDFDEMTDEQKLDMLKTRARLLGVNFSNNISVDTLLGKIQAKMAENDGAEEEEEVNPLSPKQSKQTLLQTQRAEQLKLIRLRITNLDPKKKDLKGEIVTFANEVIGNVRKMVPYGEATDNGFHVPYCLYKVLRNRKFLDIKTFKVGGQIRVKHSWVREFALEVLDPLTKPEIARLAASQSAAGGLDD